MDWRRVERESVRVRSTSMSSPSEETEEADMLDPRRFLGFSRRVGGKAHSGIGLIRSNLRDVLNVERYRPIEACSLPP